MPLAGFGCFKIPPHTQPTQNLIYRLQVGSSKDITSLDSVARYPSIPNWGLVAGKKGGKEGRGKGERKEGRGEKEETEGKGRERGERGRRRGGKNGRGKRGRKGEQ